MGALMVMNMLIGVLCEVVSAVAATEKEEMSVSFVMRKMKDIMAALDVNGDGKISRKEFMKVLGNVPALKVLTEVGVDPAGLVDFVDFIFEEEDTELNFEEFMEVILDLRGSNSATVKDMMGLTKVIKNEIKHLSNTWSGMLERQKRNSAGSPSPGTQSMPVVSR